MSDRLVELMPVTKRKLAKVAITTTFLMHEDDIAREQEIVFGALSLACRAMEVAMIGGETTVEYQGGERTEFPKEYVMVRRP